MDISSPDSAWQYVHVVSEPGIPLCRSDSDKEGLIFDIDKECKIEVSRHDSRQGVSNRGRSHDSLILEFLVFISGSVHRRTRDLGILEFWDFPFEF